MCAEQRNCAAATTAHIDNRQRRRKFSIRRRSGALAKVSKLSDAPTSVYLIIINKQKVDGIILNSLQNVSGTKKKHL